eukprot:1985299-Amphidinium_carterae.1
MRLQQSAHLGAAHSPSLAGTQQLQEVVGSTVRNVCSNATYTVFDANTEFRACGLSKQISGFNTHL